MTTKEVRDKAILITDKAELEEWKGKEGKLREETNTLKEKLLKAEKRAKDAEGKVCTDCPVWRKKAQSLAGKYFRIIKELKQELRILKKESLAKLDSDRRAIKEDLLTKLKLQLLQMQRRDQLMRDELVSVQQERVSSQERSRLHSVPSVHYQVADNSVKPYLSHPVSAQARSEVESKRVSYTKLHKK